MKSTTFGQCEHRDEYSYVLELNCEHDVERRVRVALLSLPGKQNHCFRVLARERGPALERLQQRDAGEILVYAPTLVLTFRTTTRGLELREWHASSL